MKKCNYCDMEYADSITDCPSCGAREYMKFCDSCGQEYGGAVCPHCRQRSAPEGGSQAGNSYQYTSTVNTGSGESGAFGGRRTVNKWVTLLLCVFLGYAGVHKFYEGKIAMGLIYLFTGGLCGVGWLIDIIIILFKPSTYYAR